MIVVMANKTVGVEKARLFQNRADMPGNVADHLAIGSQMEGAAASEAGDGPSFVGQRLWMFSDELFCARGVLGVELRLQILQVHDGVVMRLVVRQHVSVAIKNFSANRRNANVAIRLPNHIGLESFAVNDLHKPETRPAK